MITIGVMSGTSLDGADAVAVRFTPGPAGRSPETIETLDAASLPMPAGLGETLRMLAVGTTDEIERMGEASVALADLYAAVTERLLEKLARRGVARTDVAAIGVHGQTIRHRPEKGFTLGLTTPRASRSSRASPSPRTFARATSPPEARAPRLFRPSTPKSSRAASRG